MAAISKNHTVTITINVDGKDYAVPAVETPDGRYVFDIGTAVGDPKKGIQILTGAEIVLLDKGNGVTATRIDHLTDVQGLLGTLRSMGHDISEWSKLGSYEHMAASFERSAIAIASKNEDKEAYGPATAQEADDYRRKLGAASIIAPELQAKLVDQLKSKNRAIHPMTLLKQLQTLMEGEETLKVKSTADFAASSKRVIAVTTVLTAMVVSFAKGNNPEDFKFPKAEDFGNNFEAYDHVKNFAVMCGYSAQDKELVDGMKQFFIMHADHGDNLSTAAAEAIHSGFGNNMWEIAPVHTAALKTPRHGGANVDVINNFNRLLAYTAEEILAFKDPNKFFATPENEVQKRIADNPNISDEEIEKRVAAERQLVKEWNDTLPPGVPKVFIAGVGHRVHKVGDPRAEGIKQTLQDENSQDPLLRIAKELERQIREDDYFVSRRLPPNVDFFAAVLLYKKEIPVPANTTIFAAARTAGYLAQIGQYLLNTPLFRPQSPSSIPAADVLLDDVIIAKHAASAQKHNSSGVGAEPTEISPQDLIEAFAVDLPEGESITDAQVKEAIAKTLLDNPTAAHGRG